MDCFYKLRHLFYYKVRQVLQSAMDLLQIATGITKCDDYYKLRQYIPAYGKVGVNQKLFGRYEMLLKDQNCVLYII